MEISPQLKNSIAQRGLSLAITVVDNGETYECIDGNKRCSALFELSMEYPEVEKYTMVLASIKNDFSKAGSSYWGGTRNTH